MRSRQQIRRSPAQMKSPPVQSGHPDQLKGKFMPLHLAQ